MRGASRSSREMATGVARRLAAAVAIGFALFVVGATQVQAQAPAAFIPPPPPAPTPSPVPTTTSINSDLSAGAAVQNLGSNFLERLGNQATNGFGSASRSNSGGGGAPAATEEPKYRTWGEAYGISTKNEAQPNFVGDQRVTFGGVAGFGARLAPGINVGFLVDQSRTSIDAPLAMQTATLDLTQFGFNASVDKGPWTWAIALVHGFGKVGTSRDTGLGFATAGYNAQIDGALTELSYYWSMDQSRIVPKVALEYTHASTGAFQEAGGLNPEMATGATMERSRVLLGAEIGHYWIIDRKILDLSAYGKFVDNMSQNFSSIVVSLGPESIAVQGIGESQYGADAGASASLSLTNTVRLYLNYDGKFRAAMQSHQGTMGIEVKF